MNLLTVSNALFLFAIFPFCFFEKSFDKLEKSKQFISTSNFIFSISDV